MTAQRIATAAALLPFTLALFGAAAWMTGVLQLASFHPDYIPMAPSTAIGFVILSASMIGFAWRPGALRSAAGAAAALLSLLAALKLVEFFTGVVVFNLEASLVEQPGDFGAVPLGRMSPMTAVAFLFCGIAFGNLAGFPRRPRLEAGLIGALVAAFGATVTLGYIYGAPLLYGGRIIPMALPTALAFVGAGTALVALAGPSRLPLRWFAGETAGARLLRVFLPLTVAAVVTNGLLTSVVLKHTETNPALLAALLALASAIAAGAAVSREARILGSAIDRAEIVLQESRADLERRVRARTEELSEANRELEAFTYSVSHDLRAPLRHIAGFAALLDAGVRDTLDDKHRGHLQKVIAAAQQMGRLIDDLLEFSRNTRAPLQKRPTPLAHLVRDAQADVRAQCGSRQVVWRVQDPLPVVAVDPALFRLVLVNLLSNAVKYTRDARVAEIEVGTRDGIDGEVVFVVRDNGVGFDMRYAHKLFGVFQRLHTPDQFHGTGIGLASVSRIVQRHGGRVWAEGAVGQGAAFYVAVPNALP